MRGTRNARDILGIPARGTLFRVAVGAPDPENFRGFCEKRSAPPFLRGKTGVCGPRYLSRIRDGGRTFLERARTKRTFSTENSHFTSLFTQDNSAGPTQVKTGGNKAKREPWAGALSGKKSAGPLQVKTGGKPLKENPGPEPFPGKKGAMGEGETNTALSTLERSD